MSFTWPLALLFLLVVPLIVGLYVLSQRRRHRQAITYSSLTLLRAALPRRSRWRRHVPIALLALSLAILSVAVARPQITSRVSLAQTTIILAMDESGSMCSTDVHPDRLAAAEKAAKQFVNAQPKGARIGLVAFAGFAELAAAPTTNHTTVDRAIGNLQSNPGTAIGAAILEAIDAISEVNPKVAPVGNAILNAAADPFAPSGPGTGGKSGAGAKAAKPKHGYVPDVIVLLTDGQNNRGITPVQAAAYAVSRGVRVYTIGYGTTHPGPLECTAQQGGFYLGGNFGGSSGGFGGGFGSGFGLQQLTADLPPLREVSRLTGAKSYTARTSSALHNVFVNLPKQIKVQTERHEVSADFAAFGAFLALMALWASTRWSPHPQA